ILILWINWFERSRAASLPPRRPSEWRISWVGRLVALSFPRLPRQSRPLGLPSRPLGPPRQSRLPRLPRQSRPLGPLGLPRHPELLKQPGLGHRFALKLLAMPGKSSRLARGAARSKKLGRGRKRLVFSFARNFKISKLFPRTHP